MKFDFLTLSLGIGALLVATQFAHGQQRSNCAPRGAVVKRLQDKYGESRQSIGLGADNSVVEVFASTETGTWTITVTRPDGIACLVAAGLAFETIAESPVAKGSDT